MDEQSVYDCSAQCSIAQGKEQAANLGLSNLDMTFFFANVYTHWIGRLPIWWIRKLAAPTDATVVLNSIPYLRKGDSISGSQITEIASWDLLYTPAGMRIVFDKIPETRKFR